METQHEVKIVIKSANDETRTEEMAVDVKARMARKVANATMNPGGKSSRLEANSQLGSRIDDGTRQDRLGVGADEFFYQADDSAKEVGGVAETTKFEEFERFRRAVHEESETRGDVVHGGLLYSGDAGSWA